MKLAIIPLLSINFLFSLEDPESLKKSISEGNFKEAIRFCQAQDVKDGPMLAKLAEYYFFDQNQVKAFETYLQALDQPVSEVSTPVTAEEQAYYDKAFQLYLDPQGNTIQETAQQILETNLPILSQHPDYNFLKFQIALAYANLGLFQKFFPVFYEAYKRYPQHYLVEKTRAILNIKLYELASTPKEKEVYRQRIEKHIASAMEIYPNDTNLYKMAIAFSSPDDRTRIINTVMNTLIAKNIAVPRHEIIFYVGNAVDVKLNSLAQQFIDKAKVWYPYSRAINTAQTYLDQKRQEG